MIKQEVEINKACLVLHNICLSELVPLLDPAAYQIQLLGSKSGSTRGGPVYKGNRSEVERRENKRINFE